MNHDTFRCQELVGRTRSMDKRCGKSAEVKVSNPTGLSRFYCEPHWREYRNSFTICGDDMLASFLARVTVEKVSHA